MFSLASLTPLNVAVGLPTALVLATFIYVQKSPTSLKSISRHTKASGIDSSLQQNFNHDVYQWHAAESPPLSLERLRTTIERLEASIPFNCTAIVHGDIFEIRRAERHLGTVELKTSFERKHPQASCTAILDEMNIYPNTTDDAAYPLAFTILTYRNPKQLRQLLASIYRPWNSYCIHVDNSSTTAMKHAVEHVALCLPNVLLARHSFDVRWGAMSVLRAAIGCFQDLRLSAHPWHHVINLAATDFPLRTNLQLVRYLRDELGEMKSDVEVMPRLDAWRFQHSFKTGARGLHQFMECQTLRHRVKNETGEDTVKCPTFPSKTPPPQNLDMKKGSFSAMLSRNFVDLLLDAPLARELFAWLEDAFIPDEYFWPTLYHSVWRVEHNLTNIHEFRTRYTHWASLRPDCGGYYEHGLCVFGVADLRWLVKKKAFYAHKFDRRMQPAALVCLEQRLMRNVLHEYKMTAS